MITQCPKCKVNLIEEGLIEKLDNGYANNHMELNKDGKVVSVDRENEWFEHCSGYYCPSCDTLITRDCPESA